VALDKPARRPPANKPSDRLESPSDRPIDLPAAAPSDLERAERITKRLALSQPVRVTHRRPSAQKLRELEALFIKTFQSVAWRTYDRAMLVDAFAEERNAGNDRYWLSTVGKTKSRGFLTYEIDAVNNFVYVAQMAVLPKNQRRGDGTRL